jgi:FKBP-type peptidyl-prolyl cis-trans isomerase
MSIDENYLKNAKMPIMNEASKNKWIAMVVAIVIVAFFFGTMVLYSFNKNVGKDLNKITTNTNTMTTTTSPEGLIIEEKAVGTGDEAVAGKTVFVNYTGTLENGTKFDSSYDRGEPIEFVLGTGRVIKGWDMGIAGMKVGGKRRLVIPADLAYGNRAVGGVIPANAVLVFEVELVGVK